MKSPMEWNFRSPCKVHGILKTESWAGTVTPEMDRAGVTLEVPEERRVDETVLEVRYSPTLAGAMVDALPYLIDYPYGCTEQTLNRFLPAVITQNTLQRMNVDLAAIREKRTNLNPQEIGDDEERAAQWKRYDREAVFDPLELERIVKDSVERLTNMQNQDGGWGWFSGYRESSFAHTTALVVRGLMVAQQNDVAIVPDVIQRGVTWLGQYQDEQIRRIRNADGKISPWKPHADNLDALVYHVLVMAGGENVEMRDFLYRDRIELSVYGKALLGLALHQQGREQQVAMIMENIEQFLVEDETNETAYLRLPNQGYWWFWYGDEIEAHAAYLKLLSQLDPEGRKAPRLVKYLLNNRKHATYWRSTRDTAYCVEAFADYLHATGEGRPDMVVEVWLNGEKRKEVPIDAENLFSFDNRFILRGEEVASGSHELEIRRRGTGPVYFNAYLTNFTLEDPITRAGLEVQVDRKFYLLTRLDAEAKVAGERGQPVDQRVEKYERTLLESLDQVQSGDLIEIELEMESKNDYEYLLFEDFKAAGFEPMEVQSGYVAEGLGAYMELRDDRVTFFVRALARGRHSLSYRMRAEIPGKFSALPTLAAGMYAPELRGNADEWKVIEPVLNIGVIGSQACIAREQREFVLAKLLDLGL
jgi:alpha-2-macroglobulin